MTLNGKLFGKVNKQVVAGHGPAREEILGHPSLFELVGEILVGENVDKELAGWFEKAVDLVQQVLVVFHVLEHLDGHYPVVVLHNIEGALIVGDVAGNDGDVVDVISSGLGGRQNVFALGATVGNTGDLGIGILYFLK